MKLTEKKDLSYPTMRIILKISLFRLIKTWAQSGSKVVVNILDSGEGSSQNSWAGRGKTGRYFIDIA